MSKLANDAPSATASNAKVMNRLELTRRLIAMLKGDEAVIGGIGNTNFDLWAAGQRPQNFYMLGSMGLAFPIALGVAIAQPDRRVVALEGWIAADAARGEIRHRRHRPGLRARRKRMGGISVRMS